MKLGKNLDKTQENPGKPYKSQYKSVKLGKNPRKRIWLISLFIQLPFDSEFKLPSVFNANKVRTKRIVGAVQLGRNLNSIERESQSFRAVPISVAD